jgi:nitrate reductase molybdenum cofactor assembly chaperone
VLTVLAAMRAHMRNITLEQPQDDSIAASVGMTDQRMREMYRLMAVAKYNERHVIPRLTWSRRMSWRSLAARSTSTADRTSKDRSVLAAFKQWYRRSGFLVNTRGELPDYLPMVLEYAAIVDPIDGTALLQEYRSVELLRLALAERETPYAGVVTAVCSTLPGPSPVDRKTAMAMAAAGPPMEMVGLEPKDPVLPCFTSGSWS